MSETLRAFLTDYGLIVVVLGAFLEGESVVVMAGFFAYQGMLDPIQVGIASFVGSLTSDQVLFFLGRRYTNTRIVQNAIHRRAFSTALRLIERHPTKFVLSFRFLYGLRIVSPIAVGLSRVPTGQYVLLNVGSAVIWAAFFTSFGYLFGHTIETILGTIKAFETVALAAIGLGVFVGIVVMIIARWRKRHPPKGAAPPSADEP